VAAGDLLLILAVACAAAGYTISGRLSRTMPGWEVISWTLVITLPVTLPATILLWPGPDRQVAASSWTALAYLAAMSMYLGFVAWNAGMALGGIARVSQVQLLQTFVTLAIAALILGERFDAETIGFALAVVAIVFLGRKFRIASHGSK
ncbi:MAG: DMT family transporter, partial [Methylobacteriaceae bacterium]|nr:DMT family transporter [Methylobacteriaceae bacterium]